MSSMDKEIEEISQKIAVLIEKTNAEDLRGSSEIKKRLHLADADRTKKLLSQLDKVSTQDERNMSKTAIIEQLLLTTWMQRLYFVVRSVIMGILSAILTFGCIAVFGSINLTIGIILGIGSFVLVLVGSRLFDGQTVELTTKIIAFLGSHRSLRNLAIDHL